MASWANLSWRCRWSKSRRFCKMVSSAERRPSMSHAIGGRSSKRLCSGKAMCPAKCLPQPCLMIEQCESMLMVDQQRPVRPRTQAAKQTIAHAGRRHHDVRIGEVSLSLSASLSIAASPISRSPWTTTVAAVTESPQNARSPPGAHARRGLRVIGGRRARRPHPDRFCEWDSRRMFMTTCGTPTQPTTVCDGIPQEARNEVRHASVAGQYRHAGIARQFGQAELISQLQDPFRLRASTQNVQKRQAVAGQPSATVYPGLRPEGARPR